MRMPRLNGLRMSRLILILLVHSSASLKQIRLAGNPFTESEGRVEVLDENGTWGTICDDGWSIASANVVCHQLGYPGAEHAWTNSYRWGKGEILITKLKCSGWEDELSQCHMEQRPWLCTHAEDVAVRCYGTKEKSPPPPPSPTPPP